jgi:threonine dehydrogenase-like Zn-dependent dehydrogenase
MRALSIDETGGPVLRDLPRPDANGEAIVRVRLAGICNTDLELTRGYMGFRGVPGHEFVGEVVESPDATLLGRRVVGEINAGCGGCDACAAGLARHCQRRSVLGILNRNGVHADCARLPAGNLHHVPDALSDEEAVFTEPLAAAYETLEMRAAAPGEQWLVLGDGKLGLLVAAALHADGAAPLLAGRHAEKLAIARRWGVQTVLAEALDGRRWDVVVECSGATNGLSRALALVRPRGTVVLKTTVAGPPDASLAQAVIDEITIVGSRCGVFPRALAAFPALAAAGVRVTDLITAEFSLSDGVAAYARAAEPGVLKVLLRP